MKRHILRNSLIAGVALTAAFAAWSWLRPYAWRPDPQARCRVVATAVTRDTSYFWVEMHLKVSAGAEHDLKRQVRLEVVPGKFLEPADSVFAGNDPLHASEIWFKFWLDADDLAAPLTLHLNEGSLAIKSNHGTPNLRLGGQRNFTTHIW